MKSITRLVIAACALALCGAPAFAQGRHGGGSGHWSHAGSGAGWHGGGGWHGGSGWHGGGGWGPGPFWGGIGLGLGLGLVYDDLAWPYAGYPYPSTVVVQQPPMVVQSMPAAVAAPPAEWVVYPRNGQSAQQMAADRSACDQWARGYPGAAMDAVLMRRAEAACLEGRGYTVR